jgi:hypothetical protein
LAREKVEQRFRGFFRLLFGEKVSAIDGVAFESGAPLLPNGQRIAAGIGDAARTPERESV